MTRYGYFEVEMCSMYSDGLRIVRRDVFSSERPCCMGCSTVSFVAGRRCFPKAFQSANRHT